MTYESCYGRIYHPGNHSDGNTLRMYAFADGTAVCSSPSTMNDDILWPECHTGTYVPEKTVIAACGYADTDEIPQEIIPTGRWLHDDLVPRYWRA